MPDFAGINITTSSDKPEWQNAHFHKFCKEFYAVQEGEIIIALRKGNTISYNKLEKGDSILIESMIEHNVYMYENTKTIVVKFGNTKETDWNIAESLYKETKEHRF